MKYEHTPGPWKVIERSHPYKDGSKAHIERNIYTERIDPQLKDHYPIVCLSIGLGMTGEKAVSLVHIHEANARLMAAAPELLEALEGLVSLAHAAGFPCDRAEAAIAKATGGAV